MFERATRNIVEEPLRSLVLSLTVATGVALAITIIAASNGVERKVNDLLAAPLPAIINLNDIHSVLHQTRDVLAFLAYLFTAALVGIVTGMSVGERRREIGLGIQHGLYVSRIVTSLLIEAGLLCSLGGLVGVGLGNALSTMIQHVIVLLPMHPDGKDVLTVFPIVTGLSFGMTALMTIYAALHAEVQAKL
jgi:ABC-type antimicrobial peptide transport system permease subunit